MSSSPLRGDSGTWIGAPWGRAPGVVWAPRHVTLCSGSGAGRCGRPHWTRAFSVLWQLGEGLGQVTLVRWGWMAGWAGSG